MKKIVLICVLVLLLFTGGELAALSVPSQAPADDAEVPVHAGGMTDTEAILVGILVALLILMVI